MAELKPVYLIHGDDHGAITARRASLKALVERQGGQASVEILTGEDASPQGISLALSTMTFALGVRVIIVDGVERFKQAEVEKHLVPALTAMPPQTTLALVAREEAKSKAPSALHAAVKAAKGQVLTHDIVKPWELPKWVIARARELGLALDVAAAKALIAQVGERQQRLVRELEKLSIELAEPSPARARTRAHTHAGGTQMGKATTPPLTSLSATEIEDRATSSAQRKAFALSDALVAGDLQAALRIYLALQRQGESVSGLIYQIAARLREAIAVGARLAHGESQAAVSRSLRMPKKAAERFTSTVARIDLDRLRGALAVLAHLELDLRGGSRNAAARRPAAVLSEQTKMIAAIERIAG